MTTAAHHEERNPLDPAWLAAAPHRLMFFTGAVNVLLATVWWLCWIVDTRWHLFHLPQPPIFGGWLHATVMQYQLFPPFFFGFLLTTFPRWMGLRDFSPWHYVPVGVGLLGGQVATIAGAVTGLHAWVQIGLYMTLVGWLTGLFYLGSKLFEERRARKGPTWHARSCFAALALGWFGLLAGAVYLNTENAKWMQWSIKAGTWLLLVPVYFTVAHRMFPFFANNVVKGYSMWRPMKLLAGMWVCVVALFFLNAFTQSNWRWVAEAAFALISGLAIFKWWPRSRAPGLLWVLFIGFAWLPAAMVLMAVQDALAMFNPGMFNLGRGPLHALYIGFFGSLLVAMVTRVTQGHSGRLLEMPKTGWFAFGLIQLVALVRILSEAGADPMTGFALSAALWIVAFLPWVVRSTGIYLRAREDGKPG